MNQNEPIFLNLYMRDTEKPKTFVQCKRLRVYTLHNSKKAVTAD